MMTLFPAPGRPLRSPPAGASRKDAMALALLERLGISKDREAHAPWSTPVALDTGLLGRACFAMDRHGRGQAVWENSGRLWTQTLGPGSGTSFGRLPLGLSLIHI